MGKLVSISLAGRTDNRKFYESTLDAYSLKKYGTFYKENKTKVNADIKALSVKHRTVTLKDLNLLLFAEMLSPKDKKIYLEKYTEEITKFD